MKDYREVTACVVDYGSFISLADRLSEEYAKVYYHSPYEQEFQDIKLCVKGDGLERVRRLDEYLDPKKLAEIDLWIFPDIAFGGLQKHLRDDCGKAVWGAFGASDLELLRTKFLKTVEKLGLQVAPSVTCKGLSALAAYLKDNEDCWVKINRFRENMETWHHVDYAHSQRVLEKLAITFGPLKEKVTFVVQKTIPDAKEIGYDGWRSNGAYPSECFQGYEKKNELYLGSLRHWNELPDAVKAVNEAFGPELDKYGYCNFWAAEIRWLSDEEFYFIDPTARMPGQTGEQTLETLDNAPELIWKAANGENIHPLFNAEAAAEATIHYTAGEPEDWKTIAIPEAVRKWVKLYHYCEADGLYHFPPHKSDELGVLIGTGQTVKESIDNLKEHAQLLEKEPISMRMEGFVELLSDIAAAEKEGMEFTDEKLPAPESVLTT